MQKQENRKNFLLGIILVAVAIVGWLQYNKTQQNKLTCMEHVEFIWPVGYYILTFNDGESLASSARSGSRWFKTQDEAMTYCLKAGFFLPGETRS